MDFELQDRYGMTRLHHASLYGHLGKVKEFINYYTDSAELYENVNIRDNNGKTALHYAVFYGHVEIVNYLLNYTNLELKDDRGNTALDLAQTDQIRQIITAYLDSPDLKEPEQE